MGSLQADSEEKQEMDDSGCIQDAPPATKNGYYQQVQLLDLCDDVLLLILKHLLPRDLKALGFTCPRLGTLVLDRSLWVSVDARGQPWGTPRLRWYLDQAVHEGTKELLISGYARETRSPETRVSVRGSERGVFGSDTTYTIPPQALRHLAEKCPKMSHIALEFCNINCQITNISHFPPTLKELSLRGTKCYDLPLEKSFLFKIQDHLPSLESLDVCQCEWVEPASLLPLSKLPALQRLYMRDCHRLTEFVAYASLATRYGFIKLEHMDLRGSPVGDSEVSALGWLAGLRSLLLAPAGSGEVPPRGPFFDWRQVAKEQAAMKKKLPPPLDPWEEDVPDYYKFNSLLDFEDIDPDFTWSCDRPKSTKPTNGTDPTDPSEPSGSSEPTGSSEPSGSSEPIDSSEPSGSSVSTDSSEPAGSSEPTGSNEPTVSSEPTDSENNNKTDSQSQTEDKAPKRKLSPTEDGPSKKTRTDREASNDQAGPSTSNEADQERSAEPRHHILNVNVGQQLHVVYRVASNFQRNVERPTIDLRIDPGNLRDPANLPIHIDPSSLVTDSAVRRFGRADGEDINYVHIGPNGPYAAANLPGTRPNRSSLRRLSMTGFRFITDRSLMHLATAAPQLEFLDLTSTNVTEQGVDAFRSIRPDCEVIYSQFVDNS